MPLQLDRADHCEGTRYWLGSEGLGSNSSLVTSEKSHLIPEPEYPYLTVGGLSGEAQVVLGAQLSSLNEKQLPLLARTVIPRVS